MERRQSNTGRKTRGVGHGETNRQRSSHIGITMIPVYRYAYRQSDEQEANNEGKFKI
jgi:hypothetical protein